MSSAEIINIGYMILSFSTIIYISSLNIKSITGMKHRVRDMEIEVNYMSDLLDSPGAPTEQSFKTVVELMGAIQLRCSDLTYENETLKAQMGNLDDKLLTIKEYVKSLEDKYHKLNSGFAAYLGTPGYQNNTSSDSNFPKDDKWKLIT